MELSATEYIPWILYNDIERHIIMEYYPVCLVFEDPTNFREKYKLNEAFGDCARFKVNELPRDLDRNRLVIYEDNTVDFISIRAMHRIIYNDISVNDFHFFINNSLRKRLLEYDRTHGNFFEYLINKEEYPKNLFGIRVHIANSEDTAVGQVNYFEVVYSIFGGNKPGLLVYGYDPEDESNYSFYVDDDIASQIDLFYQKEDGAANGKV